jgi:hypothetical protein
LCEGIRFDLKFGRWKPTFSRDEISPWLDPFIAVSSKKLSAVKAIKKAGFDIYPYDKENK